MALPRLGPLTRKMLVAMAIAVWAPMAAADDPLAEALALIKQARPLYDQGRYAEAEPLFKRALAIYQKALDPEHPSVATTLDNLAALYRSQGRDAEAEPLSKRGLAIRENTISQ
jgi:tetratricopeptide (TPR) repeat protein